MKELRRPLRRLALFIAIGTSIICAVTLNAAASTSQRTSVHTFVPSVPPGKPVAGNCWTTSIASNRPDAYRCMAGNMISDPCFSARQRDIVVCDADPAHGKRGFAMRVHGSLPAAPSAHAAILPWLLQLRDGTICRPLTGTRPFSGKMVIGYACDGRGHAASAAEVGLADTLAMRSPLWRAQRVVYRSGDKGVVVVNSAWVPIVSAWR